MDRHKLLTGKLPYNPALEKVDNGRRPRNLYYQASTQHNPMIPTWMDRTLRKAVHPDPEQRYDLLSEFIHDLTHPNTEFMADSRRPLLEKNPIAFWRGLVIALVILNCALVYLLLS